MPDVQMPDVQMITEDPRALRNNDNAVGNSCPKQITRMAAPVDYGSLKTHTSMIFRKKWMALYLHTRSTGKSKEVVTMQRKSIA